MTDPTSHIRLGVSADILPYTHQEVLDAEYKLHKLMIGSAQSTLTGLAIGAVASIFFRRPSIIYYCGGFGLGYTIFSNLK